MLQLSNSTLTVDLLDPVADQARLGARYCWGGFVWQITDQKAGPLLTGPEWPKPDPTDWNGQGLPESFRHRTRDGRLLTWHGNRGVVLGAGELSPHPTGSPTVITPCVWETTAAATHATFHTRQDTAGFHYELSRRVELVDRTLISTSRLTNHSAGPLQLEWFAHPFFALTAGFFTAEFPAGTRLAENPGYELKGRTLSMKRRFLHEQDGHLDFALLPAATPLELQLSHPALTGIKFSTSFVPSECLVWANSNTFSIEPYQVLSLAPSQTQEWELRYEFGVPV